MSLSSAEKFLRQQGLDEQIDRVRAGTLLSEEEVRQLCVKVKEVVHSEPNILQISTPVTVIGDIHGQFHDLLEIFSLSGHPPNTNYVFMGDYVDRGYYSMECCQLLFLLKLRYPRKITLLRGNHELRQTTQVYGFYDESMKKYGSVNVWRLFTDMFDHLPIGALIGGEILCLHGGLSPSISSTDEILKLDRFREIPSEGPMCDLVWSDPDATSGWSVSPRGAGFFFGPDISEQFLHENGISLIARAHQLAMDGIQTWHDGRVVTVFSAPNYCGEFDNAAAVMSVDSELMCAFQIMKPYATNKFSRRGFF
eukprot:gnl/Chilomastix_cuspidata/434.p1 GENE.gnl/Chilomastix_cuspidata/434~~gnl/Chilomastix_cuspidata/434.p1  ORF type:complete len:309 (-),score=94.88 gnl/Chilomastix_cuspidata/434:226-1152(-)